MAAAAAFVRRSPPISYPVLTTPRTAKNAYATKAEKRKGVDRKVGPKVEWSASSVAAKGFLRSQKEYNPPSDITSRLDSIIKTTLGTAEKSRKFANIDEKFKLLNACSSEFQHTIPNSLLCSIEAVKDVYDFYKIPVSTSTPLDKLKQMDDLPKNLHIQFEYLRFHPDTDTKFGGQTAFPRSSTLVTGLKYKDKYPGHVQNQTWPYNS